MHFKSLIGCDFFLFIFSSFIFLSFSVFPLFSFRLNGIPTSCPGPALSQQQSHCSGSHKRYLIAIVRHPETTSAHTTWATASLQRYIFFHFSFSFLFLSPVLRRGPENG